MIERSTFYTSTESGCISESSGFYGLSNSQKMTIINSIASGMGIPSVGSLSAPSNVSGAWNPNDGIRINLDMASIAVGNYYEIYLTLLHEKQHSDTPEDAGSAYSDYEAYKAEINHPYFEKTSPAYQEMVKRQYEKYDEIKYIG